jgi:hypothetical protein
LFCWVINNPSGVAISEILTPRLPELIFPWPVVS